jgi:hypothetical protein
MGIFVGDFVEVLGGQRRVGAMQAEEAGLDTVTVTSQAIGTQHVGSRERQPGGCFCFRSLISCQKVNVCKSMNLL